MFELKVTGMTCGGCVNSVTRALKHLDANAEVSVALDKQLVKVKSNKGQDEISAAIEDAGFNVVEAKQINE